MLGRQIGRDVAQYHSGWPNYALRYRPIGPPNLRPLQLCLLCYTRLLSCRSGSVDSVFGRLQSCYPCLAVLHGQRCAACSLLLCVRRSLITSFGTFPGRAGSVQLPQPLLKCIGLLLGRCDADAQPCSFCLIVGICCSVVCTGTMPSQAGGVKQDVGLKADKLANAGNMMQHEPRVQSS